MQHTIIISPLYKDEECFNTFAASVAEISSHIKSSRFSILVVNDGSGSVQLKSPLPLTVVNLHRNLGHQKALAIGLAYAQKNLDFDQVIIMDCDGEDNPGDIPLLLKKLEEGNNIVVAGRANRQESRPFRFYYRFYKFLFRLLTGKKIGFGNYMALKKSSVNTLVHHSEIWSHLAGAIVKSGIPFYQVESNRGKRYSGSSKMNFQSLMLHGLGAIGVFIEITAMRLLIFSMIMILLSILTIAVIVIIKFFTDKAIPGWATSGVSSMLIVLLQGFLLSLFTIFIYLSSQSQKKFIPAHHYQEYVQSVENPS